jgi:hypothetical protein
MYCRVAEPSVVFLVSPPIVRFTDYKVGQVYEVGTAVHTLPKITHLPFCFNQYALDFDVISNQKMNFSLHTLSLSSHFV